MPYGDGALGKSIGKVAKELKDLTDDLVSAGATQDSTTGKITALPSGSGGTLSTILASSTDAGAHKITNLADPTANQDAATKKYIDVVTASTQAGTSYTLALADLGTAIEFTSASAVTVTVPPNSSVAFPVGSHIELVQAGAGAITVAAGAGVTLDSPGGQLVSAAQYSTIVLRKRATDEWVVGGELASTALDKTILDAKGDLIAASANDTPAKVTAGTNGTSLRADSTQTAGVKWTRGTSIEELQLASLGIVSANFLPAEVAANSSPSSQSAYLLRVGLREGMQITGLQFLVGVAAVGAAPTGIFVGLADTNGVVLVQSGNTNGTLWTSTGFLNIAFGSTYTVPSDGSYYAFLLVNGTWGTTQAQLQRLGGTMIDDVRVDARQGGLTTPPANASSFTPVATAVLHFWVGCVGS